MYLFYICGQTICSYLVMLQGYNIVLHLKRNSFTNISQIFDHSFTTVAEQLFFRRFVHFYVQGWLLIF